MTSRLELVNDQIEENRDTDLVEKAGINDEKMEINRRIKIFKKEYEEFRSKATAHNHNDSYNDFEKVMMAVMETKRTGNPANTPTNDNSAEQHDNVGKND